MSNSIYGIGLSGLAAAQAGLMTAGHNIANVNTPGYSRQEVLQATRLALFTGAGFFGQGVNVATVRRVYSEFLVAQQRQVQAEASRLDTYHTQLAQVDNLFGDPASGLTPTLAAFFAGVNGVAAHPSDIASREQMLGSAHALVARFHQLHDELDRMRTGANTDVRSSVNAINGYASQLAKLNLKIAEANAANPAQLPNDLLDQRDMLIQQLNQVIGARAVAQGDGSVNVFLDNGQALVVGVSAFEFTAAPDPSDPRNLQVALDTGGGTLLRFDASQISGGSLAGVLANRDNVLSRAQNEIGRIAVVLGEAFNAQHRLGQDLGGVAGGDFFDVPAPYVQSDLGNSGTAVVSAAITSASALTASDYRVDYDGANYTITRLSDDSAQMFATLPQTVDGVTFDIASGAAAAGDSFLVQPTRYAARDIDLAFDDPARIAAATPIRTSATVGNAGTGAISGGTIDAAYWASPLASPVTLAYSSATGMLTGFPPTQPVSVTVGTTTTVYPAGSPVPYTAGATIAFGGISFAISGAPADGDTFTIGPNASGSGDNRNALLLAALNDAKLVRGDATLATAYGDLNAFVGTETQAAGVESAAQAQLLASAQQAVQSVSGVNLDEEAANLQKYQQAYQAAGKVMVIANELFASILDLANS
jgi:flagellar hook-associated protein 1 FlgK